MVLNLRKPNRRKFKSSIGERRKREREYYYSSVTVLVVKIILFFFLLVLVDVSFRLFHYRFSDLSPPIKYSVPALVAIFAIADAVSIVKSIQKVRQIRKN